MSTDGPEKEVSTEAATTSVGSELVVASGAPTPKISVAEIKKFLPSMNAASAKTDIFGYLACIQELKTFLENLALARQKVDRTLKCLHESLKNPAFVKLDEAIQSLIKEVITFGEQIDDSAELAYQQAIETFEGQVKALCTQLNSKEGYIINWSYSDPVPKFCGDLRVKLESILREKLDMNQFDATYFSVTAQSVLDQKSVEPAGPPPPMPPMAPQALKPSQFLTSLQKRKQQLRATEMRATEMRATEMRAPLTSQELVLIELKSKELNRWEDPESYERRIKDLKEQSAPVQLELRQQDYQQDPMAYLAKIKEELGSKKLKQWSTEELDNKIRENKVLTEKNRPKSEEERLQQHLAQAVVARGYNLSGANDTDDSESSNSESENSWDDGPSYLVQYPGPTGLESGMHALTLEPVQPPKKKKND